MASCKANLQSPVKQEAIGSKRVVQTLVRQDHSFHEIADTAFVCPRDFSVNRFVYTLVSSRARSVSVGVNMNPDKYRHFDSAYGDATRDEPLREVLLNVAGMSEELDQTLALVQLGVWGWGLMMTS